VRYFTRVIPGAQFQLIPQAAHSTMQDNPKEYNRILREFLRKMDASPAPVIK
jgi:pimeloyl-ACP methyl ester carboxylesterase